MRGPATPQRGRPVMKSRRIATASGSGTASGFAITTASPDVAEKPRFAFAANESGRSFSSTRTPSGTAPTLPGRLATTTTSSTCGASAGSERSSSRA
jgi:hypothetical protein